jgi:Tfp pilus assembly protein PilF
MNACSTPDVGPPTEVIAACNGLLIDRGIDSERRARVYVNRGLAQLRAGGFPEAEADFSQATTTDASFIPARLMHATMLMYLGQGGRAIQIIDSVVLENADSAPRLLSTLAVGSAPG